LRDRAPSAVARIERKRNAGPPKRLAASSPDFAALNPGYKVPTTAQSLWIGMRMRGNLRAHNARRPIEILRRGAIEKRIK